MTTTLFRSLSGHEKDDGTQNEDDEIASTHGDEENDDITENGEEEK